MPRTDQLPLEAVRDLVGIARALYAARKREFASRTSLEELAVIGKELMNALRLAQKSGPDTLAHRAAWVQAEDACSRLMRMISRDPAAVVVEAAVVRVRRIGPRPPSEREERRSAEKSRR